MCEFSRRVRFIDRIIRAIGKQVGIAQADRRKRGKLCGVSVDESADLGIIVSALEIVELRIGVVVVAAVADGVHAVSYTHLDVYKRQHLHRLEEGAVAEDEEAEVLGGPEVLDPAADGNGFVRIGRGVLV